MASFSCIVSNDIVDKIVANFQFFDVYKKVLRLTGLGPPLFADYQSSFSIIFVPKYQIPCGKIVQNISHYTKIWTVALYPGS